MGLASAIIGIKWLLVVLTYLEAQAKSSSPGCHHRAQSIARHNNLWLYLQYTRPKAILCQIIARRAFGCVCATDSACRSQLAAPAPEHPWTHARTHLRRRGGDALLRLAGSRRDGGAPLAGGGGGPETCWWGGGGAGGALVGPSRRFIFSIGLTKSHSSRFTFLSLYALFPFYLSLSLSLSSLLSISISLFPPCFYFSFSTSLFFLTVLRGGFTRNLLVWSCPC